MAEVGGKKSPSNGKGTSLEVAEKLDLSRTGRAV
jgi:hypothetical protein